MKPATHSCHVCIYILPKRLCYKAKLLVKPLRFKHFWLLAKVKKKYALISRLIQVRSRPKMCARHSGDVHLCFACHQGILKNHQNYCDLERTQKWTQHSLPSKKTLFFAAQWDGGFMVLTRNAKESELHAPCCYAWFPFVTLKANCKLVFWSFYLGLMLFVLLPKKKRYSDRQIVLKRMQFMSEHNWKLQCSICIFIFFPVPKYISTVVFGWYSNLGPLTV